MSDTIIVALIMGGCQLLAALVNLVISNRARFHAFKAREEIVGAKRDLKEYENKVNGRLDQLIGFAERAGKDMGHKEGVHDALAAVQMRRAGDRAGMGEKGTTVEKVVVVETVKDPPKDPPKDPRV